MVSYLVEFMLACGFTRLHKDRCVFIKAHQASFTIVSLYVDDLLILAPTMTLVQTMKDQLNKRFQMSDLGEVQVILGWQIKRKSEDRTVLIHQTDYISRILEKFGMTDAHPIATPMEGGLVLRAATDPQSEEDKTFMAKVDYRSLIGSIMYLAVGTRPDLAFAFQQLSQFLHNPAPAHWHAAKRVLRYLISTPDHGIVLGGKAYQTKPLLSAYVDANYAMCPDTRRCVSGFITLYHGGPISWLAKKQPLVTLSTTEAEFVALAQCVQELLYLKQLANELHQTSDQPMEVFEDNQSTIKIASNSELHGRSKHIDVRYFFVRDLIDQCVIKLSWCPTDRQLADFFTKSLPKPTFKAY